MSMQSVVMSKPSLTRLFMSRAPESLHVKGGASNAARVVQAAVTRTRAYPAFLGEHGVTPERALRPEAFAELPLTSKRTYVERFALDELCLDGKLTSAYTIEKSSGYSGGSNYWFRTPEEDALFPAYMEFAFRQFYRIDTTPTLIIIGLAMGTWTSGEKMAQALREVAATGKYPLTITSPGINLDEILETVRDISPYYGQTVIVGYPPFMKSVIDEGIERGIDWASLNVRLGLGGEGYSEEWRAHVASKIGVDTSRDLLAVSGGYGAADLGMSVGREYPLTVLVRQLATADRGLARDLFGSAEVPNLFQYSPSSYFIEEIESELVFTVLSGIPLVRYRIGDRGGTMGFEHVMQVLDGHGYDAASRLADLGYDRSELWQLPFFYCLGRTDGAIMVGGLNVYPENVGTVLLELDDEELLGHKIASATGADEYSQRLLVLLEHRDESLPPEAAERLAREYAPLIAEGLKRVNKEYRRLSVAAPALAEPVVKVYGRGRGPFAADAGKIKRKYVA
ncbi:MAG: phenylacetate--CoA ligase family protein [Coriobacteriia bacterium]|nr:phenylacetate--CoA ligase family protein [Coriobacteriia bacterium]